MAKCAICNKTVNSGLVVDAECFKRAAVFPCEIGTIVYCIEKGYTYILKQTVVQFSVNARGKFVEVFNINEHGYRNDHRYFISEFGKTIFFTEEDAKKALEAM